MKVRVVYEPAQRPPEMIWTFRSGDGGGVRIRFGGDTRSASQATISASITNQAGINRSLLCERGEFCELFLERLRQVIHHPWTFFSERVILRRILHCLLEAR